MGSFSASLVSTPQDIIALPMDEFNDLIGKQGYSEEQLNMCRDIRKRGKNKVSMMEIMLVTNMIMI